jgi:hypothetical protein
MKAHAPSSPFPFISYSVFHTNHGKDTKDKCIVREPVNIQVRGMAKHGGVLIGKNYVMNTCGPLFLKTKPIPFLLHTWACKSISPSNPYPFILHPVFHTNHSKGTKSSLH